MITRCKVCDNSELRILAIFRSGVLYEFIYIYIYIYDMFRNCVFYARCYIRFRIVSVGTQNNRNREKKNLNQHKNTLVEDDSISQWLERWI